jgi:hypothetical protein
MPTLGMLPRKTTRASAAKDVAVDKEDELSHNTKADVHTGKPCSHGILPTINTNIYSKAAKN